MALQPVSDDPIKTKTSKHVIDTDEVSNLKRQRHNNVTLFSDDEIEASSYKGKSKENIYDLDDIVRRVENKAKSQKLKNNRIFSVLVKDEKAILRENWIKAIMFMIEESCKTLVSVIDNPERVAGNANNELDAGTGKTRVLKFIIAHYYLVHNIKIEVTASTGKAALELKSSGNADKKYQTWLREIGALIIDECSMINSELLDSIVHLFKSAGDSVFLNTHFIISGDFFQLPPVSGGLCFLNENYHDDNILLRDSWKSMNFIYVGLREIFRQEDPEFKCHCTNLRYGFFNETTYRYFKNCTYLKEDAIRLFSQKRFRDMYNNSRLNKLPGNDIIIRGFDTSDYIKEIHEKNPSLRTLNDMEKSTNPVIKDLLKKHKNIECIFMNHTQSEYEVRLRLNCRVLVIQNYSDEVVNGSSGTFVGWSARSLSDDEKLRENVGCNVRKKYRELDEKNDERYYDHDMIIRLDDTNKEVLVGMCEMSEEDNYEKKYTRKQFPIILSYALTIHKSQGTTLKRVVVDTRGCTQKLAYTAVSRVISRDSLGILNLTAATAKRLSEPVKEDHVVKEFYSHYVGIDIPKQPLTYP
ncbi:19949_t:CDS:2 [Dentiscutata erythropus]|uniref:19949_t:CDS:1 n=1 Tax=Dentiscutata erythropus TaxID=1348616 RepID=A0A9N9NAK6_9GLOM|nr:19949_t:CDS:2 [Dentiscutata erythropus]